ncbi:MAG: tRNA dihydrouridine synthase DusB [Proteiniphilum sp.]|nr:tRNA dihydrouridine synthase DusB [Proteiniphilum sp.]
MKIANIEFPDNPVFLAPMEDVTDIGFRLLCKRFGADMVYTEFVSSDALIRDVKKTKEKILFREEERPIGIQIYGSDPDAMVEAARICEESDPDLIDINFGCPVKKIAGRGAGSGMMRTPDVMLEITKKVVKAVNKPVTVKTRLGWDDNSKIIVELAEQLQDCGIAALTLHGRTRVQMYKGEADWSLIGEVKNNPRMHIPIIGNGDVTTVEECRQRFDETGVDAVMIGRGSIGQPWFFKEVKHYLQTGEQLSKESFRWYLDILKEQITQSVERIDEMRGILHNRRHLASTPIFKGIPDFKATRIAMLRANTMAELFEIMDEVADKVVRNEPFKREEHSIV